MKVFGDEQQQCPCYKECQEFQKLVELKDSGLVVYCHRPRTEDIRQAEAVERAVNTTKDVIILYNKKNVKISSSELTSELEKENISCPRCRKRFEHAQELLQEVKSIDRNMVMGICDQCRKKSQASKNPFCSCDKIVNKFISVKGEQKKDRTFFFKTFPLNIENLGKDTLVNKQNQNEYSDFQINRGLNSPASKHEPEIQQMFLHTHFKSDDAELSETNLIEGYVKQTDAFIRPIEPVKTSFAHTPHEGTSLVDSETTFVETSVGLKELPRPSLKDRKQQEIIEDRPSTDAKDALKRRHDLTLRQMMRLEKDHIVPNSISKRPDIYKTPKIAPWAQKEPTLKYYVESEMNIKIPTLKHNRGPRGPYDLDYVSNREIKTRASQHSYYEPKKADKYHHDKVKQGLYGSEEGPKKVKKLEDRYIADEELKLQRRVDKINHKAEKPEQHVTKSKSAPIKTMGNVPEHQYSFFFPKVMEKEENKVKVDVSSSHLIKDTQEKLRLQAEREKKKQEEKRQKKLEQAQKKKLAQEEKLLQDEEAKEQAVKDQKKYEVEQKKLAIEREDKDQKIKPEKEDPDIKLKTEKTDNKYVRKPLQKENEDKGEKDAPSKKGKTSKMKRDASDETNVSMSNIQKSLIKDTSGKHDGLKVKQEKGKESESKTLKKESSIALSESSELKKLQAEHLKEKGKALKNKIQLEHEAKVVKSKEEAKRDELKRRNTNMREESDEILKLVILKQAAKWGDINPDLFLDSDLELDALSLDAKKKRTKDKTDIVIGEKIFKNKLRHEEIKEPEGVPILFQKKFCVESDPQFKQIVQIIPQETKPEQEQILLTKMEPDKGVLRYALSDRTFIDKGWTMLPTEKVMRKMNVYRMRPAHPEFDWFEHNKNKRLMTYDTGERLAEFDDNGRGRWYYRNGRLALDYYDAEETNVQQRFVIYSSGEPDERGRTHPITILATFDYLGNGIVFDHAGKIRLKYNQTEGVVLDRGIGPVSHWQWHSLNDPPVLQQVMIDTQMALKDPNILKLGSAKDRTRPIDEEMLAIEFDNFIKEKSKKLTQKFKPFQIRMKALKINEHFSLKVLDQATVYLIFRDGSTNFKLNIGMKLDHQEIVDTDTAEMGEVSNTLERFPARTDSLAGLQRSVAHAQRYERQHAERERRLRPPEPSTSADNLTAAVSPPMRLPLRTVPTESSYSTGYSSRKPTNNLYYDTRLRC